MAPIPYAELHAHTNFSMLDGASPPDELVERAVAQGLTGLAATDRNGLYGSVRFVSAAQEAGLHPVIGTEIDLLDAAAADPGSVVVLPRRARRPTRTRPDASSPHPAEGRPARPRPERARLPGHRDPVKEDLRGINERARGPHLVLLARSQVGWRSLCRLVSRANLAGTKGVPRFRQALLEEHHEGLVALSGCRDGEIARRLRVGDRAGARAVAERYASIFGRGDGPATSGFFIELSHHLLPDDDWLVAESAALAAELGLPVVVTNDVHYATPDDRELHDVLTAIKHGRTLDSLADLRRPDGESYLKSGAELGAIGAAFDGATAAAWRAGIATSVELAASCSVDLGFEQYRFPGFPVPDGETPFSYLSELCWQGRPDALSPVDPARRQAARPRARRHRASRPRRVLPHLLGPDALREGAGDPCPGSGQRDELDRVVHPRDQPGRADRPQPAVRTLHQSGPDDLPGCRHRLQLGAPGGGHPVRLPALRAGAHGDGLQSGHVPGALGGPRGRLRAGVPASARRSRRQGARDVRQRHGPARPRGGRRVRRVLPADGRGTAGRGTRGRGGRGARLRRQDGPAEHQDPARREGAALAPATRAGGSERPTTVRLAPSRAVRRRGWPGRHPGERGLAAGRSRDGVRGRATARGRPVDPDHGMELPPPRTTDRLGRPNHWDPAPSRADHSSVARVEPEPRRRPAAARRSGSATGSAGSSSVPASTASRATSRSTAAGCS